MNILLFSLVMCLAASGQQTLTPSPPPEDTVQQKEALPSQIPQLRARAEAGDADAENASGIRYRLGDGVDKDKEEAVRWYRKAAKHESAAAMFNMGAAYYNGDGVEVDDMASCAWFLLAQEAGHSEADEAVRRAASENPARITEASVRVAEMYQAGEELPKNDTNALKWYRKAADGGAPDAAVRVASILLAEGRNPSQAEYLEARKRCQDAADLRYSPGIYGMAVIYRRGLGVAKDPTEAAKWLTRAADLEHPKAVLQLGEAYWKGEGVKADLVTAYMLVWLAYNSKVAGADWDEEALRKEMSQKDIGRAKKKADEWARQHRFVVLRQRSAEGASPKG